MSLTSETSRLIYEGNGITVDFPVTYDLLAEGDLDVYTVTADVRTDLALNVDYSVAQTLDSITTAVPVATGTEIYIDRNPAVTQPTDFVPGGVLKESVLETSLDRIVMLVQSIYNKAANLMVNSMRVPNHESINEFPDAATRADTIAGFDETGETKAWTPDEILGASSGAPDGVGVPAGGAADQVLGKASGTDYDVDWQDVSGIPAGGAADQVLGKVSGTDYDVDWQDVAPVTAGVPSNAVAAATKLGSGSENDGVVITSAVLGAAANAYGVLVTQSTVVSEDTTASFVDPSLVVTLGADGAGAPDPTKATPAIVAAAIDALAEFTAFGDGSTAIAVGDAATLAGGIDGTVTTTPASYVDNESGVASSAESNTVAENNWIKSGLVVSPTDPIRRMAFLGDSLVGYAVVDGQELGTVNRDSFPFLMKLRLKNRFRFIPNPIGQVVWSYGGHSARQIMDLGINEELMPYLTQPGDAVFVLLGTNDLGDGFSGLDAAKNILEVWDYYLQRGIRVVGSEIPPVADNSRAANTAIANATLAAAANARGVPFVLWHDALGPLANEFYNGDNVHINGVGYDKMADHGYKYLLPHLTPEEDLMWLTDNWRLAGASGQSLPAGMSLVNTTEGYTDYAYEEAEDGGNDWLTTTITSGVDEKDQFNIGLPQYSDFAGSQRVALSVEVEFENVSGPGVMSQQLRYRANGDEWHYDGFTSSNNDDYWMAAAHGMINTVGGKLISEPRLTNELATVQGYTRILMHASSVVKLRIRNFGLVAY